MAAESHCNPDIDEGAGAAPQDEDDNAAPDEELRETTKVFNGWRCSYKQDDTNNTAKRRAVLKEQFRHRPRGAANLPAAVPRRPLSAFAEAADKAKARRARRDFEEKVA
eukprot:8444548-Alexandrium_andersonii.AAC.1